MNSSICALRSVIRLIYTVDDYNYRFPVLCLAFSVHWAHCTTQDIYQAGDFREF